MYVWTVKPFARAGDRDDVVKLWDLRKAVEPSAHIRPQVCCLLQLRSGMSMLDKSAKYAVTPKQAQR